MKGYMANKKVSEESQNIDNKEEAVADNPSIGYELNTYINHISCLNTTLGISMKSIREALSVAQKRFDDFVTNEKGITHREVKDKHIYSVKAECVKYFEDLYKTINIFKLAEKTIPRSFIMSLVSQYDVFLGRLLRIIFIDRPELLNSSERTLSYSQLKNLNP